MEGGSRFDVLDRLFADSASWPSAEEALDVVTSILRERSPSLNDTNDVAAAIVATLSEKPFQDMPVDSNYQNHTSAVLEVQDRLGLASLDDGTEFRERANEVGKDLGEKFYVSASTFGRPPAWCRSERAAHDKFVARMIKDLHLDISTARGRLLMLHAVSGSTAWEVLPDTAENLLSNTAPAERSSLLSSPVDRSFADDARDYVSLLGCIVLTGNPWAFKLLDKYVPEWTSLVDSKGRTPFFYARSGYALRYISARGGDPTLKSHFGLSAVDFFRDRYPNNKVWNDAVGSSLDPVSLLTASI
ncbi:MAG: hypothetical protein ABI353_05465, partial [Isosphaeraceae bacterium]